MKKQKTGREEMAKKQKDSLVLLKKYFTKKYMIRVTVSAILLGTILVAMIVLNQTDPNVEMTSARKQLYAKARVTAVLYDNAEPDYIRSEGRRLGRQDLEILITQGEYKGEVMQLTNYMSALGNVDAKVGTNIVVRMAFNDDGTYYPMMHNYDRGIVLAGIILFALVTLVIVAGKKGIMMLVGISFTLSCLWFILVPLVLKGYNPIMSAIIIVALTASGSLILLDGFTKKSMSAILGSISGVTVAGISVTLIGIIMPLNGFNMSEAEELMLRSVEHKLNISGLLVCGILISSLGAVMDIAMSIASAISELHELNPNLPAKNLFKSGMNIGRDALGATANTLILAFVGSALNLLILARMLDIPFLQLINSDFIVIEILQGVIGTFGIILTVPFVAIFGSRIIGRKENTTTASNRI